MHGFPASQPGRVFGVSLLQPNKGVCGLGKLFGGHLDSQYCFANSGVLAGWGQGAK